MVGFVIPVEGAAVRQALAGALGRLDAGGCLLPYPPDYWHITIVPPALLTQGGEPAQAGDLALLPAAFAREALPAARAAVRDVEPFDVSIRGLNAFRDVLVAVPYDSGRGLEIGRALRRALPELPERYHTGHDPVPHISLAQYARADCVAQLTGILEAERDTPLGSFRVERLEMFVLPVRDGAPGPVQKHDVPLGRP